MSGKGEEDTDSSRESAWGLGGCWDITKMGLGAERLGLFWGECIWGDVEDGVPENS